MIIMGLAVDRLDIVLLTLITLLLLAIQFAFI